MIAKIKIGFNYSVVGVYKYWTNRTKTSTYWMSEGKNVCLHFGIEMVESSKSQTQILCFSQLKHLNCLLDAAPHYCTWATFIRYILDKALLSILCLYSLAFFMIYCHFLCNRGDHRRPVRVKKKRQRKVWEREMAVIEKQKSISGDLILLAPKKK